jgi:uncharacterized protein (TIGR02145 family)
MKKITGIIILQMLLVICFYSCQKDKINRNPAKTGAVVDIDGNKYVTVKIGSQEWMAENLKTTRYRNGDTVPNISDDLEWNNLTTGAWCYYDKSLGYGLIYGKLYNWFAVHDSRNLAPEGWHVATDADWSTLTNYLGGQFGAGGMLKETDTIHWQKPNSGATNETGFSALPGGYRDYTGAFYNIGSIGYWWSSTENNTTTAWFRFMLYSSSNANWNYHNKGVGFAVRCVRD